MRRWVYHYESIVGPPEMLKQRLCLHVRELLGEVLEGPQGAESTAEGDLLVRLPAHVLGRDLHKTVRLRTGVVEQRGGRTVIPLRWHAEPGRRVFPSFDGTIELEPQSSAVCHLTIVGAASLPFGPVGGAADAAALGAVAERTVRHVTARLADALRRVAAEPAAPAAPAEPTSDDELRVVDVMTPDPFILDEGMPLKTGALLLFHYRISGAPVVNAAGGLVGVLSESDLLDAEAPLRYGIGSDVAHSRRRRDARTVGEACSRPAREVALTASVRDAAELLRAHDVARLIVVDGSGIVGIVSRHDVLQAVMREDAEIDAQLRRLLAEQDETDVRVFVEWGIVTLRGRAALRSTVRSIVATAERLDGVIAVDEDLKWDVDDVVPDGLSGQ